MRMELWPVNWAPSQMVMWPVKTQAPPTTQYLPKVTEPDQAVPERVTMSTTRQKIMFFVYAAITLAGAYLFANSI